MVYPTSNYILVAMAVGLLALGLVFLTCAHYTRHEKIFGVLEPSAGIVKLYAPQIGKLKSSFAREGMSVHKGDVLLVFATEHEDKDGRPVETELDAQLGHQLAALHQELNGSLALQEADTATARTTLAALLSNRDTLNTEIARMSKRIADVRHALESYERLEQSGFMSSLQVQGKSNELIDQEMRMNELLKTSNTLNADIKRTQRELDSSPLHTAVIKAQLSRSISTTQTELSKQQKDHDWSVVAPCDGVVTSLNIAHNQTADPGVPLVTIVPKDSVLRAKIYAPSHSVGFLQPGQRVNLKFDAFPYQKFGFGTGRVAAIADSPVLPNEISLGTRLAVSGSDASPPSGGSAEPLYTVLIDIDRQFIEAYGQKQRLRPGMQLDADVQLDTRSIYEWLLEPLYSMRQN